MNALLAVAIGLATVVVLAIVVTACLLWILRKYPVDRDEDAAEADARVKTSTRVSLTDTHPHMRAGSVWGRDL